MKNISNSTLKGKYLARWNNAVRVMNHINQMIQSGYVILDELGFRIKKLSIQEDPDGTKNIIAEIESSNDIVYLFDGGFHINETVTEFNSYFKSWSALKPVKLKIR